MERRVEAQVLVDFACKTGGTCNGLGLICITSLPGVEHVMGNM